MRLERPKVCYFQVEYGTSFNDPFICKYKDEGNFKGVNLKNLGIAFNRIVLLKMIGTSLLTW